MKFKIYDESRLDDHIELVLDVIKDWEWISWYPTKEQLKQVYSREGFTADTRHYLYDEDKLVGFLSTAVEENKDGVQHGSIHRLFVRKGYEDTEDKIMKHALDLLKSRGVEVVRTNLKPGMGNLEEIYERWGFGERTKLDYSVIFPVEQYLVKEYTKPDYIIDIDFNTQKDLLIEAIHLVDNQPKDEIAKRLDSNISNNRLFGAVVAKKDEQISAYTLLFTGNKPERSFMFPIAVIKDPSEQLIKDIFQFSVQKAFESKKKFLYHQVRNFDLMNFYNDLNLEFVPSFNYILRFKNKKK